MSHKLPLMPHTVRTVRDPYVLAYRLANPESRAVRRYTLDGSTGTVRRAYCVFCHELLATCSNEWPETKTFRREIAEHTEQCGPAHPDVLAYLPQVEKLQSFHALKDAESE